MRFHVCVCIFSGGALLYYPMQPDGQISEQVTDASSITDNDLLIEIDDSQYNIIIVEPITQAIPSTS